MDSETRSAVSAKSAPLGRHRCVKSERPVQAGRTSSKPMSVVPDPAAQPLLSTIVFIELKKGDRDAVSEGKSLHAS